MIKCFVLACMRTAYDCDFLSDYGKPKAYNQALFFFRACMVTFTLSEACIPCLLKKNQEDKAASIFCCAYCF